MRNPDRWHDSDDPDKFAAGAGWLTWKVALFSVIGVLVLSGLVWLVMFGTSDIRGRGDAQRDKNSGTNRVQAQQRFHELRNEITSTDRKITAAYAAKQANPDDKTAATNYTGLVNHCEDTVADYNTAAKGFSTEEFRDADLPEKMPDPDDLESTDCKEN